MNDMYLYQLFAVFIGVFFVFGWFFRGVWEAYRADRLRLRKWAPLNRRIRGVQ